jgi:two-component system sensor histidine kinase KdpD
VLHAGIAQDKIVPDVLWWQRETLGRRLAQLAPEFDLIEVGKGERREGVKAPSPDRVQPPDHFTSRGPLGYLWAAAISGLTTMIATPLRPIFDLANIVMVFLLAVVIVAVRFGRGPAVLAAFFNVAAFDFFFVPPRMSFAVSDVQYLLTFGVMLTVGLITGQLTAGLRFQARIATHREARSRALFEVARDLSSVLMTEQCVEIAEKSISREFHGRAHVFLLDLDDRLQPPQSAPDEATLDIGTARWSLDHDEPAGSQKVPELLSRPSIRIHHQNPRHSFQ